MQVYSVKVTIHQQDDGLWRAEVPGLDGCFVDAATIADALREIQDVAAMFIDILSTDERPLPATVTPDAADSFEVVLPVLAAKKRLRARSG